MISVMDSAKTSINEEDNCLDSRLWHACAGSMVQLPPLNSKVFYFPQGHAEHASFDNAKFGEFPRIPPYILCRVSAINFMADPETDEVFAKLGLIPLKNHNNFDLDDDKILGFDQHKNENPENPTSFAKTLTQSDANNGGGFSVPRYCAETIFPKLDYTADPPVQNISAKDVQGQIWKFRHIYRGTPRRHLLTTGWSNFVNNKKLVAGDSIVFLKSNTGEIRVGIRRAKRGIGNCGILGFESVIEAANLAANGEPFEVFYYPRANTPEFCVKASTVITAMRIQWCSGMRFKMPFETEDSSRISWFTGTVSSVHVNDQIRWPNSPWRLLQVSWDEPDLLQNVKRVNPWLVETVSNMPAIHLSPFSPPRKKSRIPEFPDFRLNSSFFATNNIPTSIQGARHNNSHFLSNQNQNQNPQFNKIETFRFEILNGDNDPSRTMEKTELEFCHPNPSLKNEKEIKKKPAFVLFGQPILTEEQLSESWSGDGSVVLQNGPVETSLES